MKSFTEAPLNLAAYGPLASEDGARVFTVAMARVLKDNMLAARIEEIGTREEALALKGVRLYVDRDRLPAPEDDEEYYQDDLVGLAVEHIDGRPFGEVKAILNQGATDLIEIWRIPGIKG
ncbi:MAG: ribosome maturation factor RimM, partial [Pseudomonadota bacterium]